jgi:transcriptional regulator of arginine metabolism
MQTSRNFMHSQAQKERMLRADTDNSTAPARRTTLAKIIREQSVGRQSELVAMLRKLGHVATQSSVSRDLRELGVAKLGDRYVLPEPGAQIKNDFSTLKQFVSGVHTAGTNLTVLRTTVGAAQSVAVAIDTARWSEVIGTISGDDTIFIATAGAREQLKLGERLHTIFGL